MQRTAKRQGSSSIRRKARARTASFRFLTFCLRSCLRIAVMIRKRTCWREKRSTWSPEYSSTILISWCGRVRCRTFISTRFATHSTPDASNPDARSRHWARSSVIPASPLRWTAMDTAPWKPKACWSITCVPWCEHGQNYSHQSWKCPIVSGIFCFSLKMGIKR